MIYLTFWSACFVRILKNATPWTKSKHTLGVKEKQPPLSKWPKTSTLLRQRTLEMKQKDRNNSNMEMDWFNALLRQLHKALNKRLWMSGLISVAHHTLNTISPPSNLKLR